MDCKINEIVMMMGLPRSGKSTYVDKYFSDYQIVCGDDIRLAMGTKYNDRLEQFVWATHAVFVEAAIIRGKNVVIDSTNTTLPSILKNEKLALEYGYKLRIIFIDTPLDICLDRNIGEDAVPVGVMGAMQNQLKYLLKSGKLKRFDIETINLV